VGVHKYVGRVFSVHVQFQFTKKDGYCLNNAGSFSWEDEGDLGEDRREEII